MYITTIKLKTYKSLHVIKDMIFDKANISDLYIGIKTTLKRIVLGKLDIHMYKSVIRVVAISLPLKTDSKWIKDVNVKHEKLNFHMKTCYFL